MGPNLSAQERDAYAKARGLTVITPGPRDLFIDLDADANEFHALMELANASGLALQLVELHESSTIGHYHALVRTLFDLTPELRIALQAGLGSDRKRELLSCARIVYNIPDPTTFFEKPAAALAPNARQVS